MTADERIRIIRKVGDIILERKDELARLETLDTGKPLSLSSTLDIPRAAFNFHFFADFMRGAGTEAYQTDDLAINYAIRRPVGVVGLINPWNLPLLLLTWKLAPCLAAGNTAVIKPAELTPMTATLLGKSAMMQGCLTESLISSTDLDQIPPVLRFLSIPMSMRYLSPEKRQPAKSLWKLLRKH